MTNLYVQEYAGLAETSESDSIPVLAEPPLASYVVNYSAGVASGPAYNAATKWLSIQADSICSIRVDGTVATLTDRRIPANVAPIILGVQNVVNTGTGHVSAITNT